LCCDRQNALAEHIMGNPEEKRRIDTAGEGDNQTAGLAQDVFQVFIFGQGVGIDTG
jgi:hypothetical protein